LRILVFPEYAVEKPHVVVDSVYTGLLPARGHTVTVVRPAQSATTIEQRAAPWGPGALITFPHEPTGSALFNIGRARRKARWLARAVQVVSWSDVDVVLVRNDLQSAATVSRVCRRLGLPFVFQISSPDAEFRIHSSQPGGLAGYYSRARGRIDRYRRRRACRESAAVLAISARMQRHLAEVDGIAADKIFSFPMGIGSAPAPSPEQVLETGRRLSLPAGKTMVYSGVIDAVRSPGIMLEVFERVRVAVPDAALLVLTYQQDERRAAFEAEASARGLPVTLVGPLHHSEVARHMACADVVLSPYPPRIEHAMCSPTKSIEGMALGLPVVGNEEVVEHVRLLRETGGGLAVPYDADAFARAVVFLMQHPDERRRMGEAGRAWATVHRSYERLTRYLESILLAVVEKRRLADLAHDSDLAASTGAA
jgi:glycosyltransferase involved in cell wall biosynthesis